MEDREGTAGSDHPGEAGAAEKVKKTREKLQEMAEAFLGAARALREDDPMYSFKLCGISIACQDAAEIMERLEPKETEMEGGGGMWWKVCPECHGYVADPDVYCRHCGQALIRD